VAGDIGRLSRRLLGQLRRQEAALRQGGRGGRGDGGKPAAAGNSAEMFEMARRYSRAHAGAACVQMWVSNRGRLGEFFGGGEWLAMSLARLLSGSEAGPALRGRRYEGIVAAEMARLYEENRLFSISPWRLADR
jgi:hypothetical protein